MASADELIGTRTRRGRGRRWRCFASRPGCSTTRKVRWRAISSSSRLGAFDVYDGGFEGRERVGKNPAACSAAAAGSRRRSPWTRRLVTARSTTRHPPRKTPPPRHPPPPPRSCRGWREGDGGYTARVCAARTRLLDPSATSVGGVRDEGAVVGGDGGDVAVVLPRATRGGRRGALRRPRTRRGVRRVVRHGVRRVVRRRRRAVVSGSRSASFGSAGGAPLSRDVRRGGGRRGRVPVPGRRRRDDATGRRGARGLRRQAIVPPGDVGGDGSGEEEDVVGG